MTLEEAEKRFNEWIETKFWNEDTDTKNLKAYKLVSQNYLHLKQEKNKRSKENMDFYKRKILALIKAFGDENKEVFKEEAREVAKYIKELDKDGGDDLYYFIEAQLEETPVWEIKEEKIRSNE